MHFFLNNKGFLQRQLYSIESLSCYVCTYGASYQRNKGEIDFYKKILQCTSLSRMFERNVSSLTNDAINFNVALVNLHFAAIIVNNSVLKTNSKIKIKKLKRKNYFWI